MLTEGIFYLSLTPVVILQEACSTDWTTIKGLVLEFLWLGNLIHKLMYIFHLVLLFPYSDIYCFLGVSDKLCYNVCFFKAILKFCDHLILEPRIRLANTVG